MGMRKRQPKSEKVTVLVVEDSEEFSSLLLYILEAKGYTGVRLLREEEFMKSVQKEQPVTILMDLALQHRNGFELLHELWRDVDWKSTPVVVITGRDLEFKEQMLLQEHGAKYIRKGRVPTLELHKVIQETVERAKASRDVKP